MVQRGLYFQLRKKISALNRIKKGSLVSVIVRQGKIIIPFGNDHIEENDHVVIISVESGIADLNEVLYK